MVSTQRKPAAFVTGAPIVICLILVHSLIAAIPAFAQWLPDGAAVCTAAGDQTLVAAVPDGSSGVIVFWEDRRAVPARVRAQRLNAAGVAQWTADGIEISSLAGAQTAPVATVDGVGGAIVAWEADTNAGDVYAQRIDGAGVRQWGANGVIVAGSNGTQWKPLIVSDFRPVLVTTPGALIAYESTALDAGDLYVAALDAGGAVRWITFAAVGPGRQGPAALVTDGSSTTQSNPRGALLAWRDERVDANQGEIYAQRVSSAGAPLWGAGGALVCPEGALTGAPSLVQVAAGTGIVAWSRFTGLSRSDIDVRAERIGGAGSWGTNGVAVCDFGGRRGNVSIVRDAALGAIVAWRDQRSFFEPRVYAQRIDQFGVARWADDGIPVGGELAPEGNVATGPANAGGVVTWTDRRYGNDDLFAQRVDSTGTLFWNPWGVPVTRAANLQYEQVVIGDGASGAIVVWHDYRGVDGDIYAQRVFNGEVVGLDPLPASSPRSLRLGPAVPNPVRAGCALALDLPVASTVDAEVLAVTGRRVRTLLVGDARLAGRSTLRWDGCDDRGAPAAPGLYFVRVVAGSIVESQRVVVVTP